MMTEYWGVLIEFANVFVALFVLVFAFSFLRKTVDHQDRRPWVYLFVATMVFFFFELVGVLGYLNIFVISGLRNFLESAFIALILFVFIFQYDLILKSDLILITKKIIKEEEAEEQLLQDKLANIRVKDGHGRHTKHGSHVGPKGSQKRT